MTSQNALANAKLLFKALASREANLDEPIPDDRIMDVAAQIGLERGTNSIPLWTMR